MNAFRFIAIPGTLLDAESVAALGRRVCEDDERWSAELCGELADFDDECERLASAAKMPVVWIGHSLGGILALNVARRFPATCRAVIALASTARADATDNRARRLNQLAQARLAGTPSPVSLELKPVFGIANGTAIGASLMRQAERVGVRRFENQTHYAIHRPDLRLSGVQPSVSITCPLLAIAGSDDDICPADRAREMAQLSARGEARVIAGAGHLFPMTHADAASHLICDFLQRQCS